MWVGKYYLVLSFFISTPYYHSQPVCEAPPPTTHPVGPPTTYINHTYTTLSFFLPGYSSWTDQTSEWRHIDPPNITKFVTNLEHEIYRTQPKVYKILKQISKDVKETACIQGNIDENVFLQYYEKLWNTTNINELQLEYNSPDYLHAFITLDELEKVLKLTKNG